MPTKKELTKGRGKGDGERGGGEEEGGSRKKKKQKEKRKQRKQDYNLIKAGTVAYLRSKASGNIGLQSREIVKAFTSMVGARPATHL